MRDGTGGTVTSSTRCALRGGSIGDMEGGERPFATAPPNCVAVGQRVHPSLSFSMTFSNQPSYQYH